MSETLASDGEVTAVRTGADPRRWWALTVISLATVMVVLDATIVNVALPQAQAALHISDADRQWVVTAYTLPFGGLLLLGGRIADFGGRRRAFLIGLVGFALASGLGGAATTQGLLFSARALQGVFAALLAPAALSLLNVTFTDRRERATAFGVYGAVLGGGSAIGLLAGGLLTNYLDWRWCLYVNIAIAAVAFVGAIPLIAESRAAGDTRYDIPGAVLVTAGLALLVYGFAKAVDDGWGSATTVGPLAGGAVLVVAFVAYQARARNPLLPLRIALDRNRGGFSRIGLHSSCAGQLLGPEIVVGIGMAGVLVPVTNLALLGVGGEDSGVAGGLVSGAQQVGGSIGTALLNTVAATTTTHYLLHHHSSNRQLDMAKGAIHGYSVGFLVAAVVFAAGAVTSLWLINAGRSETAGAGMAAAS